jgi:hypothetical protein
VWCGEVRQRRLVAEARPAVIVAVVAAPVIAAPITRVARIAPIVTVVVVAVTVKAEQAQDAADEFVEQNKTSSRQTLAASKYAWMGKVSPREKVLASSTGGGSRVLTMPDGP